MDGSLRSSKSPLQTLLTTPAVEMLCSQVASCLSWQWQEPDSCSSPPVPLSPNVACLSFPLNSISKEELGAILFFSRADELSLQCALMFCIQIKSCLGRKRIEVMG